MNTVLSTACNAVLAGLFLVSFGALFGRTHPLIDSFGQFLLPAIVGAAALALLAFLTARYATGILAIVAILLEFGHRLAVDSEIHRPRGQRTALQTIAVQRLLPQPRLDLVAPLARKTNADIVVLLEMVPRVLAQTRRDREPTTPTKSNSGQRALRRVDPVALPADGYGRIACRARARRSLASATCRRKGRTLTLFAAHLTLPFPFRASLTSLRKPKTWLPRSPQAQARDCLWAISTRRRGAQPWDTSASNRA